jgi:hypothetical protein
VVTSAKFVLTTLKNLGLSYERAGPQSLDQGYGAASVLAGMVNVVNEVNAPPVLLLSEYLSSDSSGNSPNGSCPDESVDEKDLHVEKQPETFCENFNLAAVEMMASNLKGRGALVRARDKQLAGPHM